MNEIVLILIFYIIPGLFVGLAVYFDEEIQSIGDFVEYLWAVLIPVVNIFMFGVLLVNFIVDFIKKKIKLADFWEKIKNTKIKNKISETILPTYTLDINIESPKQETLEEAAERYANDNHNSYSLDIAFEYGGKWQEEKQDDFAIGFVVWCDNLNIGEWSDKTTKELLEIYKKIKK